MNLRDRALQANDIRKEPIEIPEWGFKEGDAFVKTLTAGEKSELENSATKVKKKKGKIDIDVDIDIMRDAKVRTVIVSLCDDKGENIFTIADLSALKTKSSAVIDRVFEKSNKLNKLKVDEEEEEKN